MQSALQTYRKGRSVNTQSPGENDSKSLTLGLVLPMAHHLMEGAGKLNEATQSTLLLGAKKLAVDGSGVKIAKHWGIAAENAARAWWGNGPLRNGGRGIQGGNAKLELIGNIVAVTALAAVVVPPLVLDIQTALAKRALKNTCESCQEAVPDAPVEGEPDGRTAGPHCGHGSAD